MPALENCFDVRNKLIVLVLQHTATIAAVHDRSLRASSIDPILFSMTYPISYALILKL